MKRVISLLVIALAVVIVFASAGSSSHGLDISGLSLEQLQALKDDVQKAIVSKTEFSMIKVDPGIYRIGLEIPAGFYKITSLPDGGGSAFSTRNLDNNTINYGSVDEDITVGRFELPDGMNFQVKVNPLILHIETGGVTFGD